jgi:hypothetical protein
VKTSPKRSYSVIENERIGLVFAKTVSIISGTGEFRKRQELVLEVDEVTYTSTVTGTYSELNTGARQLKYYTNLQPFKGTVSRDGFGF